MKIKTWIKYEESYLPKRCRKPRYRECEEYINVNLKEVNPSELRLAFEDNSYEGKGRIYFYNNKLWSIARRNHYIESDHGTKSALEDLIWANENCSSYFRFEFDRKYYSKDTSKDAVVKEAKKDMNRCILVDGELYEVTSEPRYCVNTFGLGHNHGGTGMFCDYSYNPNIRKDNYFSAADGNKAVDYANKIAAGRGDTESVGKFEPFIIVHMPEVVKINPGKQHGDGNELLNTFESIIDNSSNQNEAGLLCMAFGMASNR